MRKIFLTEGCPMCAHILTAVHMFNDSVPPDREIDVVWEPEPDQFPLLKEIHGEIVEYPTLIFDGIVVKHINHWETYFHMLKELDRLEGGE